jgi:hypothetical protein
MAYNLKFFDSKKQLASLNAKQGDAAVDTTDVQVNGTNGSAVIQKSDQLQAPQLRFHNAPNTLSMFSKLKELLQGLGLERFNLSKLAASLMLRSANFSEEFAKLQSKPREARQLDMLDKLKEITSPEVAGLKDVIENARKTLAKGMASSPFAIPNPARLPRPKSS